MELGLFGPSVVCVLHFTVFVWLLRPLFLFNYVTGVNVRRPETETAAHRNVCVCVCGMNSTPQTQPARINFILYLYSTTTTTITTGTLRKHFRKKHFWNFQYMCFYSSPVRSFVPRVQWQLLRVDS